MGSAREMSKRETGRRVIAAAGELFAARGFDATTVRDIAENAGVSLGTVMAVGDKNALLVRVFDGLVEAEHEQRASAGPPQGRGADTEAGTAERLLALVRPFVALFGAQQSLARSYAAVVASGTQASTLFSELAARLIGEFEGEIIRGGVEPDSAGALARAAYFAYVGVLFTWSSRGSTEEVDLTGALEHDLRDAFAAICLSGGRP